MARYIDADALIYSSTILHTNDGGEVVGSDAIITKTEIDQAPTADVVPKSEYEKAVKVIEKVKCLTAEIKADLPIHNKQIKTETAREIFKELDGALAYCMESHPYAIERYCEIKKKYIE